LQARKQNILTCSPAARNGSFLATPSSDTLLAMNILGSETIFSWIPEYILCLFFYRDLYDISPAPNSGKGFFTETPMIND
jgi:hypothetical protein